MAQEDSITLKSTARRELVTEQAALADLERWRQEPGKVTKLDLSCRPWPVSSLDVLRPYLEDRVVPTIESLKIDDVIAGLVTDDGLATLQWFGTVFGDESSHLVRLNVDQNALGTRGVANLLPLLHANMKEVTMETCGLAEEVVDAILPRLMPQQQQTTSSLQVLALGENMIGPEGARKFAKLISKCTGLEVFKYNGCRPQEEGTLPICQALADATAESTSSPPPMRILNLCDCTVQNGDDENHPIYPLCEALARYKNLEELNLRDCEIQPAGLGMVLDALEQSNATLRSLDLSGNELEVEGSKRLATFLSQQPQLEKLWLDTNELGTEGFEHIVPFLRGARNLKVLDLQDNEIDRDGALRLLEIPRLEHLEELLLRENELSVGTAARIKEMYPFAEMNDDDDLGEDEEEEDEGVDNLVNELAESQI